MNFEDMNGAMGGFFGGTGALKNVIKEALREYDGDKSWEFDDSDDEPLYNEELIEEIERLREELFLAEEREDDILRILNNL